MLKETYQKQAKSKSGCQTITGVFECGSCDKRPLKEKCFKAGSSKKPLDERHKVLNVSKRFIRQREAMEEKTSSPEGRMLRANRSILAEGTFASIKEDMNFRQFLLRGREKTKAEWLLLFLELNMLKLHHKIQNERLGTDLIIPKDFLAGLRSVFPISASDLLLFPLCLFALRFSAIWFIRKGLSLPPFLCLAF
ncbi:MAG: transposase [Acidaminococcaceae bacterium]|nr:transposase [Acidaminococcaceae bacterium]